MRMLVMKIRPMRMLMFICFVSMFMTVFTYDFEIMQVMMMSIGMVVFMLMNLLFMNVVVLMRF